MAGQDNTYYPMTYNQYSVWICKKISAH